jgi:CDP-glucose 4,6-dehydratase
MVVCEVFSGRRTFVTGLTGFKGIWLARWLEQLGAIVSGLALPPEPDMLASWPGLCDQYNCVFGDIRESTVVAGTMETFRPEIVFHLAAQPIVRRSYRDPVETFATNVMGTVHVLEAAWHTPSVRAVVVISSDKCYLNREWLWGYREVDAFGGHDPYSASKACTEIVTAAYRQSYRGAGSPLIASARAGNVIGGGDWAADRLVPDMIRSMRQGKSLCLRSPGSIRPWQHVLEPLSGYLLIGAALLNGDESAATGWNFGPHLHEPMTVRQLAHLMIECWGSGQVQEMPDVGAPHEARYLKLDSTKAMTELHWRPLLSVAERVAWSIEWYKANLVQPASAWSMSSEQIRRYSSKIATCPEFAARWFQAEERRAAA